MERNSFSSIISLRLDNNESNASLEKLKFWNPQNITSFLNKPNVRKYIPDKIIFN